MTPLSIKHIGIVSDGSSETKLILKRLIAGFLKLDASVYLHQPTHELLSKKIAEKEWTVTSFDEDTIGKMPLEVLLCVGGDGTVLRSVNVALEKDIPLLGLNTGRLGFLSNNLDLDIQSTVLQICQSDFQISERSTIRVQLSSDNYTEKHLALNEISILRKESTAMIALEVDIDNQPLNNYWGDGLLISSATGSTGYSLSCGGPIIDPDLQDVVLVTPVAPHNLNVRPLLVGGNKTLDIKVKSRSDKYLLSLDTKLVTLSLDTELRVSLGQTSLKLGYFEGYSFWNTLHEKLFWGIDKRNQFHF